VNWWRPPNHTDYHTTACPTTRYSLPCFIQRALQPHLSRFFCRTAISSPPNDPSCLSMLEKTYARWMLHRLPSSLPLPYPDYGYTTPGPSPEFRTTRPPVHFRPMFLTPLRRQSRSHSRLSTHAHFASDSPLRIPPHLRLALLGF